MIFSIFYFTMSKAKSCIIFCLGNGWRYEKLPITGYFLSSYPEASGKRATTLRKPLKPRCLLRIERYEYRIENLKKFCKP